MDMAELLWLVRGRWVPIGAPAQLVGQPAPTQPGHVTTRPRRSAPRRALKTARNADRRHAGGGVRARQPPARGRLGGRCPTGRRRPAGWVDARLGWVAHPPVGLTKATARAPAPPNRLGAGWAAARRGAPGTGSGLGHGWV
jgi:hypothetical protein